jgi:hypothetical protein
MIFKPTLPSLVGWIDNRESLAIGTVIQEFWNSFSQGEMVIKRFKIDSRISEIDMFASVKSMAAAVFGKAEGCFVSDREAYVSAPHKFLIVFKNDAYLAGNVNINSINEFVFDLYGLESHVIQMQEAIEAGLSSQKLVKLTWYYKGSRGTDSASLHVTNDNHMIHNEFYPWLTHGVDTFVDNYLRSNASILVLYGPPGTGKTSFLRYLLTSRGINAAVTYDERILREDSFFVEYLTDEEHNALIVEDADLLLSPRENGQNDMMSKFLNVSDGLVRIANKKLIFTTNITQLSKIDSALLRPGRCFAAVEFRELTSAEASAAASVAQLSDRDWSSQDYWSLSQLFNPVESNRCAPRKFRVGFV